ncbi:MAG: methyl-accepting chemotaxis protein [Huintestinicola sp.]
MKKIKKSIRPSTKKIKHEKVKAVEVSSIRSIKKHIIIVTLMIVMIPLLILGTFCCTSNQYSSTNIATTSVEEMSHLAAQRVEWELESFRIIAEEAGCNVELADANTTDKRKQDIISLKVLQYDMDRGCVIDKNGMGINGIDYSDREYFKNAMDGKTTVTEPMIAKSNGKVSIIVAAPLWDNGVKGKKAVGCVYFVPHEEFLNDIVRELKVSDNSTAYILDKNGTVIADLDTEVVASQQNLIAMSEEYPRFKDLASVHQKMIAGEEGAETIKFNGQSTIVGYAPIAETDGWSIGICAPSMDFIRTAVICVIISIVVTVISAVISAINSARMGRDIGDPIAQCTERLKLLSQGDLSSPVPEVKTKDETKILADATETLVNDMNSIIGDIGRMLGAMANGDFNVDSSCGEGVYKGDFHVLIESVTGINNKLSHTLSQINTSADQVSNGSDQVSGGAQSLSQGATEQASSIEELSSTIHTISDKVTDTTEHCINGKRLTEESAEYIDEASQCMNKLTEAMQDISEASNEISRIIKAIEDIAFQTNILALNAAVEAARAGDAGKGFAVVADEVRNLASKSSEAAQETTVLIERAISAVENGTGITEQTARAVADVAERSEEVKNIVAEIAEASTVQADMISQVTQGMEQISGVVQTNSATAEQSAAASEELSGQALMLKKLVGNFKLRK